jgi:hypothetical protein
MDNRTRICVGLAVMFVVAAPATGCGGDDNDGDAPAEKAVDGMFVGKVAGTDALVAVVAAPGKDKREAQVYVSDGTTLSEWFPGSVQGNSFTATSEDDDAEAHGKLSKDSVAGTLKLPDGKTVRYEARRATAASGLYELTVSGKGRLSGASAAGVGLTSKSKLRAPGSGSLKFADGNRREFKVTTVSDDERGPLRAGQVRMIVLPDGQMSGAGVRGSTAGDGEADFYIRSSAE